ncbi:MAG: PepSY domain-containing protein [Sphingomonadales bacterium]|nr:PepSY domain-containing protein [Sphingomonadales bacterium]
MFWAAIHAIQGVQHMRIGAIHRSIGIVLAAFWIAQALSGIAIQFRPEIDDPALGGATAVDPAAIGRRVETLQSAGDTVGSLWATGGTLGQFDIYLTRAGESRTVRIAGDGTVLRDRADAVLFSDGAVFETLIVFHESLMLGRTGELIIGLSGLFLITTVVLGLKAGWPRRRFLATLFSLKARALQAQLLSWHRLLGFVFAVPALIFAAAGVALVWKDGLEHALEAGLPSPDAPPAASGMFISPGQALSAALDRYPNAAVAALTLPGDDRPWYRIRLRAPGEMPRQYGATTLYIAAAGGSVLLDHDARKSDGARLFIEALYPVHTGQVGSLAGRVLSAAFGLWLLAMIAIGLLRWRSRRVR